MERTLLRLYIQQKRSNIFRAVLAICTALLSLYILPGCSAWSVLRSADAETVEVIDEVESMPKLPVKGGDIVIAVPPVDTLNPLLAQTKGLADFLGIMFEGLFEHGADMKPEAELAYSWQVQEEGKLWSFQIRQGIEFHDGEELTGEDVVFTFIALRGGLLDSPYRHGIADNPYIETIEVDSTDPYTVYVRLNQPISNMLHLMTFPVLPMHIYQSDVFMIENQNNMALLPVGTGSFKIDPYGFEPATRIDLVRNPEWWGEEPFINSVSARVYADDEQARNAFAQGQIDLVDTDVIFAGANATSQDVRIYRYLTLNYEFLGFNFEHPILRDLRVRKAIAYALDRKRIISMVYLNNAQASDVAILPASWLYNSRWRVYDFDREMSESLLDEAGWTKINDQGIRYMETEMGQVELRFRIMTNSESSFREDALELIAKQLKNVGIAVEIQSMPWDMLKQSLAVKEFDAVLTGYEFAEFPDLKAAFYSGYESEDLSNFIAYSSPVLDGLLHEAAVTHDQTQLKEIYNEIQEYMVQRLPVISLYFRTASLLVNERIMGIGSPLGRDIYSDIEKWYVVDNEN